MHDRNDTIAAVATGKGEAAIGIVRISGPEAGSIIDKIVPTVRASTKPRRVLSGTAHSPGTRKSIDEVLCFYCPGPQTATGEDTAEIHGHGGPLTMRSLLEAVIGAGAAPAKPGEFTYRAYRNGRFDLCQAEAIMSLIGARSDRAQQLALRHLEGGLGLDLDSELAEIIDIAARIEARLDFPDDDLPLDESDLLVERLGKIAARLRQLENSYKLGERIAGGARVAIIGPPNAGKSSLLNALLNEERALVDEEPGTTRDVVEARSEADGIPITFWDTAGIRSDSGRVESRGIEKTIQAAEGADLVVVVLDGTCNNAQAAGEIAAILEQSQQPVALALNKSDLEGYLPDAPAPLAELGSFPISAQSGEGIHELLSQIGSLLSTDHEDESHILTTMRQKEAVHGSTTHVEQALSVLESGADTELAAADLRWAREQLAALWGRTVDEDVTDAIFSSFCLGK